jgi:hypothetical protein
VNTEKRGVKWPITLAMTMVWGWICFVVFIFLPDIWSFMRFLAAAGIATVATGFVIIVLSGANEFEFKDRKEHR